MRIIGIDSSSTRCGIVYLKDEEVQNIELFVSNKKEDIGLRLHNWGVFLQRFKAKRKVDCIAVEKDSVNRNLNTIRMLSYFESVALAKAGEWRADTLLLTPLTARKQALGSGTFTKEDVYDYYKKRYKITEEYGKGGNDKTDALCVAFAAERILQS